MEGSKSVHQRDGASKEAEESAAGGSALARCSSFKQGDRVIVVGRDAEGAKTFRTATVATVRCNSAPLSWWGQPWRARRRSVDFLRAGGGMSILFLIIMLVSLNLIF